MEKLEINGVDAVKFIKGAYGLNTGQIPKFDMSDETQTALRMVKGWIQMAERDAIQESR